MLNTRRISKTSYLTERTLVIDVLIENGTIIAGDSSARYRADIAIVGDKIAFIGNGAGLQPKRTIDASGLIIAPGLIDPHSHSDWSTLGNREAYSTVHQGVTTEVVGNCGVTYAPLTDYNAEEARNALATFGFEGEVTWRSFGELLAAVHQPGTSQNLTWFVGHTAIRSAAELLHQHEGVDREKSMQFLLEEAFDAGAIGFSTGLEYGSGRFANTDEMAALSRTATRHDGIYASHIRNRDAGLGAAVDEFFKIAKAGNVKAQISHLNVRYGTGAKPGAWEEAVARVYSEREGGVDVLADMTPYRDGIGLATGILPEWVLNRSSAEAAQMLSDPGVRTKVRADADRYWRFVNQGEWQRVVLGTSPATPELEGLTFPQISTKLGKSEWDCFFDILSAAGSNMQQIQLMGTLFTDSHLADGIRHPLFLLGVDAFTSRKDGPLAGRTRHPLFFHGHSHYLSHHVLKQKTLTFEEAIHKMTGMVANHFGIARRGLLREGYFADIAAFDEGVLAATDTFALPEDYARGTPYVLVNGEVVIDESAHTLARPGVLLRRQS